jgi:hypothetical protein
MKLLKKWANRPLMNLVMIWHLWERHRFCGVMFSQEKPIGTLVEVLWKKLDWVSMTWTCARFMELILIPSVLLSRGMVFAK